MSIIFQIFRKFSPSFSNLSKTGFNRLLKSYNFFEWVLTIVGAHSNSPINSMFSIT